MIDVSITTYCCNNLTRMEKYLQNADSQFLQTVNDSTGQHNTLKYLTLIQILQIGHQPPLYYQ